MAETEDIGKFIEPTDEDMITKLSFGVAMALGQRCPECPQEHYCDAICVRFKPKIYKCTGCGEYQKHDKMVNLIARYRTAQGLPELHAPPRKRGRR